MNGAESLADSSDQALGLFTIPAHQCISSRRSTGSGMRVVLGFSKAR